MLWDTLTFSDLDEMRRDVDAIGEMFLENGEYGTTFPLFNAYEDRESVTLIAVAPGLQKDKLDLRFEDGTLTLAGERPLPVEENAGWKFLRHEREHGRFEKTFRFPVKVEKAGISAKLENGYLVIRAPKLEEAKAKQIDIKT